MGWIYGNRELPIIELERPLFGQFARRLTGLPSEELGACLTYQVEAGGRLGEIFIKRGVLSQEQFIEVLKFQARWVAATSQTENRPSVFPYPAFLSLCLPAYNENSNIEDTLTAACAMLPEFVERFEVVVVDDGSVDGTGDTVRRFADQ